MLNLLWLLLPVAAAAGWIAAKRNSSYRPDEFWNYSANFHKSLNVLLNERQDLPAQLFDELSDTDQDTAETHLALGNLYRRRGDIERALLLHQSLLDKKELGAEVQAAARFELARDYDSAGLFDRAEQVLREMISVGHKLPDAYSALLQLYEAERNWTGGIELATEIGRETGKHLPELVAHYYCELAQKAQADGYIDQAKQMLDKALASNVACARAHMRLAEIAQSENDNTTALEHYILVEKHQPELLPEIIDNWFNILIANNNNLLLREFLDNVRQRRNAYSVIRSTREIIEKLDGEAAANRFFKDQILRRPSLKGLRDWARDQIEVSKPGEKEKVQVICALLDKVIEEKPAYLCNNCGFRGNLLHWRCPSCGQWDSVHAIIGVEGE